MYLYDGKLSTVRLVWHFCVLLLCVIIGGEEGGIQTSADPNLMQQLLKLDISSQAFCMSPTPSDQCVKTPFQASKIIYDADKTRDRSERCFSKSAHIFVSFYKVECVTNIGCYKQTGKLLFINQTKFFLFFFSIFLRK